MYLKIAVNPLKLSFNENEAFSETKKESMSQVALFYVSANLRGVRFNGRQMRSRRGRMLFGDVVEKIQPHVDM